MLTTDFRNDDIGGSEQQEGVGGEGHRVTGGQSYFKVGEILTFLYANRNVSNRQRKGGNPKESR